ncbi:MAG: hypothetical protein HQK79_19030 [Desulfobacterales bacterium]|nr:hypothetical protein [Desulfobacterales bacterium]
MSKKLTSAPIKTSIARRLFRIIWGCYFVVTLIVTCLQLSFEYYNTKNNILHTMESMNKTFGQAIRDSLWMMNRDTLKGILIGIKEMPIVTGVKVEDETGEVIQAVGNVLNEKEQTMEAGAQAQLKLSPFSGMLFSQVFPIEYQTEGGLKQVIGRWTVYSSYEIVIDHIKYGFMIILLNALIKTLALWIIFMIVVNHFLEKPQGNCIKKIIR